MDSSKSFPNEDNKDISKLIDETKREIRKVKRKDYYKILELYPSASQEQIRKQFKILSKKYHPDKINGDDEKMKQYEKLFMDVNEAYRVLSDPSKKKLYDTGSSYEELDKRNSYSSGQDQYQHNNDNYSKDYFNSGQTYPRHRDEDVHNFIREEAGNKKRKSKFDN